MAKRSSNSEKTMAMTRADTTNGEGQSDTDKVREDEPDSERNTSHRPGQQHEPKMARLPKYG